MRSGDTAHCARALGGLVAIALGLGALAPVAHAAPLQVRFEGFVDDASQPAWIDAPVEGRVVFDQESFALPGGDPTLGQTRVRDIVSSFDTRTQSQGSAFGRDVGAPLFNVFIDGPWGTWIPEATTYSRVERQSVENNHVTGGNALLDVWQPFDVEIALGAGGPETSASLRLAKSGPFDGAPSLTISTSFAINLDVAQAGAAFSANNAGTIEFLHDAGVAGDFAEFYVTSVTLPEPEAATALAIATLITLAKSTIPERRTR